MIGIINKKEYFNFLEKGFASKEDYSLRGIQDAYINSILKEVSGKKIAEMGGGLTRLLPEFAKKNECWNLDKMIGNGNRSNKNIIQPGVKLVNTYCGDFSEEVPDNYFDIVFSINVIEHVVDKDLENMFLDIYRMLKPGGISYHCIDAYISDNPKDRVHAYHIGRIKSYMKCINKYAFKFLGGNEIKDIDNLIFSPSFATNSDLMMGRWNISAPNMRETRENYQSISLKIGIQKMK